MNRYKHTLNLPVTDFPMRANLAQREPKLLKRWEDMQLYAQIRAHRKGAKSFILHDGPPYANGDIHVGHAVNKILKDIIIKVHTLQGEDAPYVPGWDCHGLPIELMVEKKLGSKAKKMDAAGFRQACRDYARTQVDRQREDFKRLGVLADWAQPYLTMDYNNEAHILQALGKMISAGHLRKANKPVHWCTDCRSALAEAEVEYLEKISPAIDVCFPVADTDAFLACFDNLTHVGDGLLSVVIWTTTPWTLLANQAVTLHPELHYQLIQCDGAQGKQRLLVAAELQTALLDRANLTLDAVLGSVNGQKLATQKLQHPLHTRTVPIILGEHVTLEIGTGAVHTAPAHGEDDHKMGQIYQLPITQYIDDSGRFFAGDDDYLAGKSIYAANSLIIEKLAAIHRLLQASKLTHSYPHCWRHKTPLIFRTTPQWFISMTQQKLRADALAAVSTVRWIPSWGEQRMTGMLTDRPDWCISRQRLWGVPIAVFIHKKTGELHPDTPKLLNAVAARIAQHGIEAWFALEAATLLGDTADEYVKSDDILDVWFDSGVTHFSVLATDPRLNTPADLYLEGSDQHRGWFQSSLLTAIGMDKSPCYRQVLTHGFTVDAEGKKMSKQSGNVVAPQTIMKSMGADILRLWVAATDYRGEMHLSDQILQHMADAYRRIRNTARYLLGNLHDFTPSTHTVPQTKLLLLDQWAVEQVIQTHAKITTAYAQYQFHHIYQILHQFCVVQMSGFYLDIIKDRLYTMPTDSVARRSAQTAMHLIVEHLVRWLAPILSFTAEEIWQHLPATKRPESVFLANWDDYAQTQTDSATPKELWETIINIRDEINKALEALRTESQIGGALDAEVTLYCAPDLQNLLTPLADELHTLFICSAVTIQALPAPETASKTQYAKLQLIAQASSHAKCERCWQRVADLNAEGICQRCINSLQGLEENRCYA